jgi:hypothetical protein
LVGDRCTILVTVNAGETWENIKIGATENLYAIGVADAKTAYAVGSSGIIFRTDDAGKTWKDQESPIRSNLFAVSVLDVNNAVAVGDLGTVVYTDNGSKWSVQQSATSKLLQAIVYRGGSKLWLGGRGGTIIRRTEPLSPSLLNWPKSPPVLIRNSGKARPQPRQPLLTISSDGDIPMAMPSPTPDAKKP